jgi:hypothetical protein
MTHFISKIWLYQWKYCNIIQADLAIFEIYGPTKIRLKYTEFAYKKTKDTFKLGDRFPKKGHYPSLIHKIAD